ncbi:2-deoxy-5-keto-D-gluconate 6-phosphate aldolase domain-containing protein [Nitriliruptor alkaliphilus]|uniref:2-deoxy-5-keto-D-gluconate 6-phosphate aldolase domain-containing protein n=1 Tax=Nitriliruptor alkaliphilus TaxID=427918 RepID=UPI0006964BAA|nr:DUF2090 domain-containing protein [Nitriliruptor alkaliphilus]
MPLGYDRRLALLALEPGAGADTASVLLDALAHARDVAAVGADAVAVLLDPVLAAELAPVAMTRGLSVVLEVDDRDQERFVLADGDGFAGPIEDLDPTLTAARVRWHPDDAPEVKKAQALGLTRLAAWLHETDRSLLLELVAPRDRTQDALREIRELGIDADVWSVPPPVDAADAARLGALLRDEGRDRVSALVRIGSVDHAEDVLRATAAVDAYRGVVFGPDLWSDELGAAAVDDGSREAAARRIGDRFAHIIDLSTAAPSA